jgi:hypothetical protein
MSWMAPVVLTRLETYKCLSHPETVAIVTPILHELIAGVNQWTRSA